MFFKTLDIGLERTVIPERWATNKRRSAIALYLCPDST